MPITAHTRKRVILLFGAFLCLGAVAFLTIRLAERTAFRSQLAPLVRADLVDLDDYISLEGTSIPQQLARREQRIRESKAIPAGGYRSARGAVVNFMEKENDFVAATVQFEQEKNKWSVEGQKRQSQLVATKGLPACEALGQLYELAIHAKAQGTELGIDQGLAEESRISAAQAWNAAYGWMRWLGAEIDPRNPFSKYPQVSLGPDVSKDVQRTTRDVEESLPGLDILALGHCPADMEIVRVAVAEEQASAVASLRALNLSAIIYLSTFESGYPPSLAALGPSQTGNPTRRAAGLIERALAAGNKFGYVFKYRAIIDDKGRVTHYAVNADPVGRTTETLEHYYTDDTNIIREEKGRPADQSSSAIGG